MARYGGDLFFPPPLSTHPGPGIGRGSGPTTRPVFALDHPPPFLSVWQIGFLRIFRRLSYVQQSTDFGFRSRRICWFNRAVTLLFFPDQPARGIDQTRT